MSRPFERPPHDPNEPPLSQREMFVGYFGFDQQPPIRPSWWADLLWLGPVDLGLLYVIFTSHSKQKAMLVVLLAVFSLLVYLSAVRVRYVNLAARHPEHAPAYLRPPSQRDD